MHSALSLLFRKEVSGLTDLYFYPLGFEMVFPIVIAMGVISQTVAMVYGLYRYESTWREMKSRDLLEIAILIQVILMAALQAEAMLRLGGGYGPEPYWALQRYLVFALVAILALLNAKGTKLWYPLLIIPVAVLTLPFVEDAMGKGFLILFCIVEIYFIMRAIHMIILCRREIKEDISASSVNIAIDSLHTGILFCKESGFTMLVNTKMKELMVLMTGRVYRNGKDFYQEALIEGNCLPGCEKKDMEGDVVYQVPNGRIYMFTKSDIHIKQRTYVQLSASDVTVQWKTIEELRKKNEELRLKGEELQDAIRNIQDICYEEESLRIKSRFHDVLGQRIALLLRGLREDQIPDENLLADFSQDFLKNILETGMDQSISTQIFAMKQTMKTMGVDLHISGQFPEDGEEGHVINDIIMEATTNAVRHGLATDIYIHGDQRENGFFMTIRNNGMQPDEPIEEGGGITQMRNKLEALGGTLHVTELPEFELIVSIPKGGTK